MVYINVRETEGAIKNGQSREIGNMEYTSHKTNKGNNKIPELRTILQRESQNS